MGFVRQILLLLAVLLYFSMVADASSSVETDRYFDRAEKYVRGGQGLLCCMNPGELLAVQERTKGLVDWIPQEFIRSLGDNDLSNDEAFTIGLREGVYALEVTLRTDREKLVNGLQLEWNEKLGYVYKGFKTITPEQYQQYIDAVHWAVENLEEIPQTAVLRN